LRLRGRDSACRRPQETASGEAHDTVNLARARGCI
jgi:hypothetical protein